jgi:hypothetical protein
VADDVAAQAADVEQLDLRLLFSKDVEPPDCGIKFHGIELHDPVEDANWWSFALAPKQMAVGRNLVTVDCHRAGSRGISVSLEKVEIHVTYSSARTAQ